LNQFNQNLFSPYIASPFQVGMDLPILGALHPHLALCHLSYNSFVLAQNFAHDQNCFVTFFFSRSIFQDLATGRMIRIAKEQGQLYCLIKLGTKVNNSRQTTTQV